METKIFSEHPVVLQKVNGVMNKVERESFKYSSLDAKYNLKKYLEGLEDLSNSVKKINEALEEYRNISSLLKPEYSEKMLDLFCDLENRVGFIERDRDGNLHCDKCLIAYKLQDMVGKKVKISHITLNISNFTRNRYPAFANHVEVLEDSKKEENKPFYQKLFKPISYLF